MDHDQQVFSFGHDDELLFLRAQPEELQFVLAGNQKIISAFFLPLFCFRGR